METATYIKKNKVLHYNLSRSGMMDKKKELVQRFSRNRTQSSTELTEHEMNQLISHLENTFASSEISRKAMVKKVIHLLCEWSDVFILDGKPNMTKINAFAYEKWKKETVWQFDNNELRKIIGVIENRF